MPLNRATPMFRFTIRDVLWLTAFIAVLLTWWADHARIAADREGIAREQRRWRRAFDSLVTHISYDGYKVTVVTPETYKASVPNADPVNASFVRDAVYVVSPNGSQSIIPIQK